MASADKEANAEGYPLTLNNCKKYKPMKELNIYGNTVQDGTPKPDAPVDVVSVGEKSVNLFDVNTYPLTVGQWLNGVNGSLSDTGYTLNACTKDYIPCTELRGKTLTLNHSYGSIPGVCFYDEEKVFLSGLSYKSKTTFTFTVPEDAVYYRFSTTSEFVNEIQIQEGTTATEYEPYGKYKIPVVQRGINLFSMAKCNFTTTTINGITFTPLDDERVHIKGKLADTTKNAYYQPNMKIGIPIKAGKYRAKPNNYTWDNLSLLFQIRKDGNFLININTSNDVINVSDDGYIGSMLIGVVAGSTREWDDIIELQLMEGTENLPYEPYVEPTTTNIFLSEPLRKLGDYADYIDYKNKKVVRNTKEVVFKGGEITNQVNSYMAYGYIMWRTDTVYTDADYDAYFSKYGIYPELSTHFEAYSDKNAGMSKAQINKWYVNGANRIVINLPQEFNASDGVQATMEDTNNWLTSQYENGTPVKFNYILKESTQEPITCELPKLNAKTSIIEVDTSILPANAYGKYILK